MKPFGLLRCNRTGNKIKTLLKPSAWSEAEKAPASEASASRNHASKTLQESRESH